MEQAASSPDENLESSTPQDSLPQQIRGVLIHGLGNGLWQFAEGPPPGGWNFPLIYEVALGTPPAAVANVIISGQSPIDLQLGPQQIVGNGQNVYLNWLLGRADSIKIGANPFNQSGAPDGFPVKALLFNGSGPNVPPAFYGVQESDRAAVWRLDGVLEFSGSTASVRLVLDSQAISLPQGPFSLTVTSRRLAFQIINQVGSGSLKIQYDFQRLAELEVEPFSDEELLQFAP